MRKLTKVLTLTICLLAIVTAGALAGCQSNSSVPTTTAEFTFTDLWEKTVAATGVQESTAQLGSFWLEIEGDGSLVVWSFAFRGENEEGSPTLYLVSTNSNGTIGWYASAVESVTTTRSPGAVFEEIDQLGIPDIPQGDSGCNFKISFEYGGAHYIDGNMTIWQLDDGQLRQLEDINFDSDSPWAVITVSPMYIIEEGVDEAGQSFTRSSIYLDGQCMKQLWFLAADMSKATNIEYLVD